MSAVDLIFAFRTPTDATVTRQDAAGSYVNGEYVGGATTDFEIQMSIQPLTAKEVLKLPEAQRTKQWVKGYASEALFTSEQSASKKADRVSLNGRNFEVITVEYWESAGNTIVPYWKVTMAEVNPT